MTDWNALLAEQELPLDRNQLSLVVKFLTLLHKWTAITNLVATSTTPRDLVELHLADSLALLPHLGDAERLIDVGSGGGLPGLVLAIAAPDRAVTAIEPIHKKHAFLAAARRELGLANFTSLPERDDQHRARPDFRPFDLAVSRAVFAPATWLERGAQLVRPGGRVLAMEGREPIDLPESATRHPYHLADRERAILVWTPPSKPEPT
ncbi:MAG TPA: 16S rRNA (guanine(527)-N(7))-methyltransferase RsmG [Kofleriaceae bacterium]|nr:16S rRNA (guanine(527)-N(7))-methyltransferase RsmG [Kofleriaceae bacterium]